MRKSVFSEYFFLCAAIISSAIICVAAVLLVVSSELYKNEKKDYLAELTRDAVTATRLSIASDKGNDTGFLKNVYLNISNSSDIDFTLVDSDGVALVCSEAPPCSHTNRKIGRETLERVTEEGFYELSSLDRFYDNAYFHYAYKIRQNGATYYLFAKMSAESLMEYMKELVEVLIVVTVIVLLFIFIALYAATKRLIEPIRDMTLAA